MFPQPIRILSFIFPEPAKQSGERNAFSHLMWQAIISFGEFFLTIARKCAAKLYHIYYKAFLHSILGMNSQ